METQAYYNFFLTNISLITINKICKEIAATKYLHERVIFRESTNFFSETPTFYGNRRSPFCVHKNDESTLVLYVFRQQTGRHSPILFCSQYLVNEVHIYYCRPQISENLPLIERLTLCAYVRALYGYVFCFYVNFYVIIYVVYDGFNRMNTLTQTCTTVLCVHFYRNVPEEYSASSCGRYSGPRFYVHPTD